MDKNFLVEKVKSLIIELICSDHQIKTNLSVYLSEKLEYDYTYLSNIFSEIQKCSIEHYFLSIRIEKVKELLVYNKLNINEISDKLHFSSVAHLSNQFKKYTGLTPSTYKKLIVKLL